MRRLLAMALSALAAWAPAAFALEAYQEESRKDFPVEGLKEVVIENARGHIELLPAPGDQLTLGAVKRCMGRDARDARALAASTLVEITREGGRLAVHVRYPQ